MQGCCYCLAQNSDVDINAITKWPKYNGFYAKVPTCLYYKNKNKVLDWGKGAKLLALKVLIVPQSTRHNTLFNSQTKKVYFCNILSLRWRRMTFHYLMVKHQ